MRPLVIRISCDYTSSGSSCGTVSSGHSGESGSSVSLRLDSDSVFLVLTCHCHTLQEHLQDEGHQARSRGDQEMVVVSSSLSRPTVERFIYIGIDSIRTDHSVPVW